MKYAVNYCEVMVLVLFANPAKRSLPTSIPVPRRLSAQNTHFN